MRQSIIYTFLAAIIIVSGGFITPSYAQQSEEDIRQMLEERNREIKALLGHEGTEYSQQQRRELKNIINAVIDYEAMARFALQDTWPSLSAAEQQEFVDVFAKVVRDHSLTNLDIYRARVSYESIEVNGDSAVVVTLATLDRVRTPVSYELFFGDEKWVVIDLSIDDVSTARSYRRQFQDIIRDEGYDYLLETLSKRANK